MSDRTTPDLNLLAAACSHDRFNVDAKSFRLDGLSSDEARLLPAVLLESMHILIILLSTVRSFSLIKFPI
jgi:hypothetical protein